MDRYPIVTIILAILTRQVMLSLMLGIFVGFTVINDHNLLLGVQGTVDGIIDTFHLQGIREQLSLWSRSEG